MAYSCAGLIGFESGCVDLRVKRICQRGSCQHGLQSGVDVAQPSLGVLSVLVNKCLPSVAKGWVIVSQKYLNGLAG
jgi:hypothetical protein